MAAIQCCAMNRRVLIRIVPVLLAVLASSSCTMWGEKKHADWKSATSGEQLVRLFWSDVKAKDWKTLEQHVGSSFVGMSPAGTSDHAKVMEHLRAMDLQDFQVGEVESRSAGADLIVTYTIAAKGTINGQPLPTQLRMMSVWQELKNGWVLVAHSSVPQS